MNKFKITARVVANKDMESRLQDSKSSNEKISSIKVKMEATHSGFVNGNNVFYTQDGMKSGAKSFTYPYPKPITVNHDRDSSPIGRISSSTYVDYGLVSDSKDLSITHDSQNKSENIKLIDKVKSFIQSSVSKDKAFKGLGHIELIGEITDEEAIKAVLSKRYLTVSIGATVDAALCSTCGQDKISGYCDHFKGDEDGTFYIAGNMTFDHVSYVNTPADPHAISEYIQDSIEGKFEILDFLVAKKEEHMKKKYQEIIAAAKDVGGLLKPLGLDSSADTIKALAVDAKASSFVFADEKLLPVVDADSAVAAFHLVKQMEDGESKDSILSTIETRASAFLKDGKTLESLEAELLAQVSKALEDAKKDVISVDVVDKLSSLIKECVKDSLSKMTEVKDSYAANRMTALERENVILQTENAELLKSLKDSLVLQIMIADNKVDDEEYKAVLKQRTIASLKDKLTDALLSKETKGKDKVLAKVDDSTKEVITEDEVQGKKEKVVEDSTVLTIAKVKAERLRIISEDGIGAAAKYINDLKISGKLPANYA